MYLYSIRSFFGPAEGHRLGLASGHESDGSPGTLVGTRGIEQQQRPSQNAVRLGNIKA